MPVEWDINQPSRWNLRWDTVWRSYMLKIRDFEKLGYQVGETKKNSGNRIYILCARWVVEMEDVILVNNATHVWLQPGTMWCMEGYRAQRTMRHVAVMRNTTQQLQVKRCALECCVGLHILRQVVYVGGQSSCLQ